jgi:hypothetical protein
VLEATYGLDPLAQEIELKPQAEDPQTAEPVYATLRLTRKPEGKTVTLVLLDASTGAELNRIEKIEVALLDF